MADQKWDYMVVYADCEPYKTPDILEKAGNDGWEAVGMALRSPEMLVVLFKESKVDTPKYRASSL